MKIEGELLFSKDKPDMNIRTKIDTATVRAALARMLTATNGGTVPEGFDLHVSSAAEPLATLYDLADGRTRLFVHVEPNVAFRPKSALAPRGRRCSTRTSASR